MGRANAWLDDDQQRKDAQLDIMREKDSTINVYRTITANNVTGFQSEVPSPTYQKTITARLDLSRIAPDRTTDSEAEPQRPIIAITDDIDVRRGDTWRLHDLAGQERWYRVLQTEAIEAGTSAILDELRRQAWPVVK